MAYTPRDWTNVPLNETPPDGAPALDAANLSRIEDGISAAHDEIDGRLSEASLSGTYVSSVDYPGITIDTSVGTRVRVGDVMVHGDTGRRAVPTVNGWAAPTSRLRRYGNLVYAHVVDLDGSAATSDTFLDLPTGFRPDVAAFAPVAAWTTRRLSASMLVRTATATARLETAVRPSAGYVYDMWLTRDAWPTTLPGTPA